ncbi:MAG: phosphoenolpyruvate carboxylase [Candidatus Asgardarchaeia archaeon]
MRKIPRIMSTQHPDNANIPIFAENTVLSGDDEVKEAYFVYSYLNMDEQMWDFEGKEVDSFVIRKLLTRYEDFFKEKRLGRDIFLTPRVPNPTVEKTEAKVLVETLEIIARSYDAAKVFFDDDIAPIFEVILPMTTSYRELNRVYYYYKKYIVDIQHKYFFDGDIKISDWIGPVKPDEIELIPLVEDRDSMLNSAEIVKKYLEDKPLDYIRVFLARSDPALNYGHVSAVLYNKIALQRLYDLSENMSIDIFPIIGVGSSPFRGNFKPTNVKNCLRGYPSVQTFTAQSAFKYDYPPSVVLNAVEQVKNTTRRKPIYVDEEKALQIAEKYSREYVKQITLLGPLINHISQYIPRRRKRKLHIGLFGYSRSVGNMSLPRAITFCAALYSIGLPPELLGLNALSEKDIDFITDIYQDFLEDLRDAFTCYNPNNLREFPSYIQKSLKIGIIDFEEDNQHRTLTTRIMKNLKLGAVDLLPSEIITAAKIRGFLG